MYTLDHNILIDLKDENEIGELIAAKIAKEPHQYCVVNIGASELRQGGVRPDNYEKFEFFLRSIKIDHLQRLNPLCLIEFTFIDHCNDCSNQDAELYQKILIELFPNRYEEGVNLIHQEPYKPIERKRLNQICDAVSLWCHLKYRTEAFVTRDKNFLKKEPILKNLFGANIISPNQLS